jgi:hypothetical protein
MVLAGALALGVIPGEVVTSHRSRAERITAASVDR